MLHRYVLACVLPALALLAAPAHAQFGAPAAPCAVGTAEALIQGTDVEAAVFTNGNLFYGNTRTAGNGYTAPLTAAGSPSPMFAGGLWVGGLVEGEIRKAGAQFNRFEFRPGLTGADGVPPDSSACAVADIIGTLSRVSSANEPEDFLRWPADLGAPVVDGDGIEGNYDPRAGDQPAIRGDVMSYWAMTDTASERPDGERPLGIDVTVEAFADYGTALATETFYRFTITNRNTVPIVDTYVGFWADSDLGNATDDFVGTDTTAHLAYTYNSGETDVVYGTPPAVGVSVVDGPLADENGLDDDRDGETDEPGERLGLTSAAPILKNGGVTAGPPVTPEQYYNRLRGLWNDGTEVRTYGTGYGAPETYPTTVFAYPGDPITREGWSEENPIGTDATNNAGDARMLATTGPVTLQPGESETFTFAVVFAQGVDRLNSVAQLRQTARAARQRAVDEGFALSPLSVPALPSPPPPPALAISRATPNPFTSTTALSFTDVGDDRLTVDVFDVLGRRVQGSVAVETDGTVEVGDGLAPGVYLVRIGGLEEAQVLAVTKVR